MCGGGSANPAPVPAAPPPPAEDPLVAVIGDAARKNDEDDLQKTLGKRNLRIDLGTGGNPKANTANGLSVS